MATTSHRQNGRERALFHSPGPTRSTVHRLDGWCHFRPPAGHGEGVRRQLSSLIAILTCVLLGLAQAPCASAEPPGLLRPVEGRLVRAFDAPVAQWAPGHRGVDLFAIVGTPVLAAADGTIAHAGMVVDRPVLSIDHVGPEGWRTTYEPVHATVTAGQRVTRGQLVGWVAASDECLVNCLHWGLRQGNSHYVDPLAWLASGGVRLLPTGTRVATPASPAPRALLPLLQQDPMPPSSASLKRPVSGPVTSPFGMRLHPVLKVWRLHDGIDYAGACGTPVAASAAGRVVLVEHHIAYGLRVVVDHGVVDGRRVRTAYTHLSRASVGLGQAVRQAEPLGAIGSTGWSTGCHLHFIVWADGSPTDPAGWVG